MRKTADVVVIGGGVNGCSIAYYLAKKRAGKICLLEKRYVASGPTGRSSGIVRSHYTIETLASMAKDSLQTFQNFEEEIGGSAGFVQTGVVFIASEKDSAGLINSVSMHQRLGIRECVLSRDELVKMEPLLNGEDLSCGAYESDSGYADPALTANSFCEAAVREGVEVSVRSPVTSLKVESNQIRGVITGEDEISTNTVINAAGPWGSQIAAMVGAEIPIIPSRHPVVLLQRPPQWRNPTPVWLDLVNGAYFKPEGLSKILVGSVKTEEGTVRADLNSYSEQVDYDTIAAFSEAIAKRFAVMEGGMAQGGWAGLYDVTPDWQPVIDRIPEVEGFYCAVGFSGHGFKLAPAVGKIVSELVMDGKCHSYDISVFRYERFRKGKLTSSEYAHKILG
jgi:sarcosine oxidase subunit beta